MRARRRNLSMADSFIQRISKTELIKMGHGKIMIPASLSKETPMLPAQNASHGSHAIKKATGLL